MNARQTNKQKKAWSRRDYNQVSEADVMRTQEETGAVWGAHTALPASLHGCPWGCAWGCGKVRSANVPSKLMESSWPFQEQPLPSFPGTDLPSRSCPQGLGQTHPIPEKSEHKGLISEYRVLAFFPTSQQARSNSIVREKKKKKHLVRQGAWLSPHWFSLS